MRAGLHNHTKIDKIYKVIYYQILKRHIYALTGPLRVLPDFIIIGTMKSGTTSLYYDLCEHPCILPAAYDEIGYFDSNFELGLNWYRSMFPTIFHKHYVKSRNNFFLTGEDTPFYFWKPKVAKRIHDLLPNVRLIVILRNPIDRAFSEYNNGIRAGLETLPFEKVIDFELKRFETEKDINEYAKFDKSRATLARSIYVDQLIIWTKLFPRKQILILSTEDLASDPQNTLDTAFQFLGIPQHKLNKFQQRKTFTYSKMDEKTRKFLIDFFRPYNERLYKFVGRDFSWDK